MIVPKILSTRCAALGHLVHGETLPTLTEGEALRAAVALRRAGFSREHCNGLAGVINLDFARVKAEVLWLMEHYAIVLNTITVALQRNDMLTEHEQEATAMDDWFGVYHAGFGDGRTQFAHELGCDLNCVVMDALGEKGPSTNVRVSPTSPIDPTLRRSAHSAGQRDGDLPAAVDHGEHHDQPAECNRVSIRIAA